MDRETERGAGTLENRDFERSLQDLRLPCRA